MSPEIESTAKVMPIRAVMTMPPAWMLAGYVGAVDRARFASADAGGTAQAISIAVGEALMWLDAIRQRDRNVGRGRDVADGLASRRTSDSPIQTVKSYTGNISSLGR
jgi:hypothetical protein